MEDTLTESVIGAAMKVHRGLGPGFLESVYANALAIELNTKGIEFVRESPIEVTYEDKPVGSFCADFVAEGRLIIELKAVGALAKAHEVQIVNYLTATGIDTGLLLNFGTPSLEYKRKSRLLRSTPKNREDNPVNLVNPVLNPRPKSILASHTTSRPHIPTNFNSPNPVKKWQTPQTT